MDEHEAQDHIGVRFLLSAIVSHRFLLLVVVGWASSRTKAASTMASGPVVAFGWDGRSTVVLCFVLVHSSSGEFPKGIHRGIAHVGLGLDCMRPCKYPPTCS